MEFRGKEASFRKSFLALKLRWLYPRCQRGSPFGNPDLWVKISYRKYLKKIVNYKEIFIIDIKKSSRS